MKLIFQLLVIILGFNFCFSQELKPIDSIQIETDGRITDFGSDDFNNIYFIKNSIELNKIDFQTRKRKRFSNQNILEDLNTRNILQLTLKSGIFNLLILDNQLNQTEDLVRFPIESDFSPSLITLVDNNYLWGYDPVLQRLILWNFREKKIYRQSTILNNKSSAEFYSKLIYDSHKIYLIGPDEILCFDEFANLEKVIPFEEFDQLFIKNKYAYYSKNNLIYRKELGSATDSELIFDQDIDYFSLNKQYLFVLKDKVVYLYDSQNFY